MVNLLVVWLLAGLLLHFIIQSINFLLQRQFLLLFFILLSFYIIIIIVVVVLFFIYSSAYSIQLAVSLPAIHFIINQHQLTIIYHSFLSYSTYCTCMIDYLTIITTIYFLLFHCSSTSSSSAACPVDHSLHHHQDFRSSSWFIIIIIVFSIYFTDKYKLSININNICHNN